MTDLLIRIFVKDHANTHDARVRQRYGTMTSLIGIAVNILIATFKLVVGLLTASVAIVADALNNFTDGGSSIVSLLGFRMAGKPADRDHPYGHARIEYISSMIVSFLILLVGVELLSDSARTLLGITPIEPISLSVFSIVVLVLSIFVKLWLSVFYRKIGDRIGSGVIRAASVDSLTDCISTGAVLICSVVIYFTDLYWIDAVVGLAVSAFILFAGLKIARETMNSLLGEAPVEETVNDILKVVSRYPDALGIHDMMVHNYGPDHYIASLHIEVDGEKDLYALHDMIDNIERQIREELGILCTIHMDPIVTNDETIAALRDLVVEIAREVDPSISVHDFRMVVGDTHTNLIFDIILPYESKQTPESVKEKIAAKVMAQKKGHYCVITVDRG